MTDRPLDELYETIRDVEENPTGALEAVQQLFAEVARLREALVLITQEYDPSDYGGISEIMFTIAGDALQSQVKEKT